MERVVVSLLTGTAHAVYELVKLKTLRRHWDGRVVLHFTQPDTESLLQQAVDEFECETVAVPIEKVSKRANSQFTTKVAMFARGTFPGDVALYLDSDVIIKDDVGELFDRAEEYGVCATQFCDWTTGGGLIAKRIRNWADYDVPECMIVDTITGNYPSPNGGIICGQPGRPQFSEWLDWCYRGMASFINDETALQMLLPSWMAEGNACILEGGAWNCSPSKKPVSLAWDDVKIVHGHGDSFVRPEKNGVEHWLPLFNECLAEDVGGCQSWDLFGLGNKHFNRNFETVGEQLKRKDDLRTM